MPPWASGRRNRAFRRSRIRWETWIVVAILLGAVGVFAALPEAPFALDGAPLDGAVERVADGDTIEIAGQRIRLVGLDAPERSQSCSRADGSDWPCGHAATDRMRELTRSRLLSCQGEGHDRYGRLLAVCRAGGTDVGETLVRDGLAVASGRYLRAEADARRASRGIWQGPFQFPADWRASEAHDGAQPAGNPSRFERVLAWLVDLLTS